MHEAGEKSAARGRPVVVATLWIAILTGFVEAALSMFMMRRGELPGVWWDLFWVSPLFDVVLFGGTGLVLTFLAGRLGREPLALVLPVYFFFTASIWLGLVLPYQVHIVALVLLSAGIGLQTARLIGRHQERVLGFWRRTLPVVLTSAALVFGGFQFGRPLREGMRAGSLPTAAPGSPNVVLIVIDALRADHLPVYGYDRDTSPALTRLASEGAAFSATFSSSPYTAPSHASLLTGLYANEHGVQWIERRGVLSGEHRTLAEVLGDHGYRTAAFSANRFWFTREQRFGRGFLRFLDNFHSLGDALVRTAYGRKLDEWIIPRLFEDYPWRLKADRVTDLAIDWVGDGGDRPFFLMLNYFDVHDPYFPPQPYRGMYADVEEPGGILNSHQGRYHPDLTEVQLLEEVDAYDGAINYVDHEIDRLLQGLRERWSGEDLVVIVTSDHGEAFGEHGAYIHANAPYMEEIHVPLILWAPGRVPAGFESDRAVSNVTVPATILDLVGADPEPAFRGPPVTALWLDPSTERELPWPRSEMEHWEWNLETSPSHYGAIRSVVSPEYHYLVNDSLGAELYRWREDPAEQRDLIDAPEAASVLTELQKRLEQDR